MRRNRSAEELTLGLLLVVLALLAGGYLRNGLDRLLPPRVSRESFPESSPPDAARAVGELLRRRLLIPVEGVAAEVLRDSFADPRSGGRHHRAIDIPAPRGTPVLAVEEGRVIAKVSSRLGGLGLYQLSADGAYCYYYAHLESYAPGLERGAPVSRGQALAAVGTTGNAPADAPHLHFAISLRPASGGCGGGVAIDPYLVLVPGAR